MSDNPLVQDSAKDTINQVISTLAYISSQLHQQANLEQAALDDNEPAQANTDLDALATYIDCNQAALVVCYEQHNREKALLSDEVAQLKTELKAAATKDADKDGQSIGGEVIATDQNLPDDEAKEQQQPN